MLVGGGADTFVYASADGNDVIADAGQLSRLVLSDISSTGVIFATSPLNADDLIITIESTGKTITVQGQLGASGVGQLQDFSFADGVTLSAAQVSALATPPASDLSVTITNTSGAVNTAVQTVSGMVTSASGAGVVGQAVTLSDNGTTLATTTVQPDGTFFANVTLPIKGSNAIIASVTDAEGNPGRSAALLYDFNDVPPTVTIKSHAETSISAGQTITGVVTPGGAAGLGGDAVVILTDNGTTVGTAIVAPDGTFSVAVSLLNSGANSIVATAIDGFGNSATSAAVVDTLTGPAPAVVTITSAAESSTNAVQTITGTVVSSDPTVVIGRTVTLTDNGMTLGTAVVQADGSFSARRELAEPGNQRNRCDRDRHQWQHRHEYGCGRYAERRQYPDGDHHQPA